MKRPIYALMVLVASGALAVWAHGRLHPRAPAPRPPDVRASDVRAPQADSSAPSLPPCEPLARALTATTGLDVVVTASSAVCVRGSACTGCARACALVVHADVDLLAVAARLPAPGYVTGIRGEEPRELSALIPGGGGDRACLARFFPDLSSVPRGERPFEVESVGFERCGALSVIARRVVSGTITAALTEVGPLRCVRRDGTYWVEEVP